MFAKDPETARKATAAQMDSIFDAGEENAYGRKHAGRAAAPRPLATGAPH